MVRKTKSIFMTLPGIGIAIPYPNSRTDAVNYGVDGVLAQRGIRMR